MSGYVSLYSFAKRLNSCSHIRLKKNKRSPPVSDASRPHPVQCSDQLGRLVLTELDAEQISEMNRIRSRKLEAQLEKERDHFLFHPSQRVHQPPQFTHTFTSIFWVIPDSRLWISTCDTLARSATSVGVIPSPYAERKSVSSSQTDKSFSAELAEPCSLVEVMSLLTRFLTTWWMVTLR